MTVGLRSNLNNCATGNFYESLIGPTESNYVYWNERVLIEEVLLSTGELICNFATAKNVRIPWEIVCYKFSIIESTDQCVRKLNVPIRN